MPTDFDRLTDRETLYAAFGRVHENGGCRGCDGETVREFSDFLERRLDGIQSSLLERRYRPLPLMRFPVPKRQGGKRWLSVPTVRDRVVQSAVYLVVGDTFEAEFEDTSHGYRPKRSVRTAAAQIRELRDEGFRWVVDADIDDFFDTIPHDELVERLERLGLEPYLQSLLEGWIRTEVYDGRRIWRLSRGIPQGSVVSPMLANLFLDDLDEQLADLGLRSVRYADDFLLLSRTEPEAEEALELTDLALEDLGLDLNRDKTALTSFDGGFRFLGLVFLGDEILKPLTTGKRQNSSPSLPSPLTLERYVELREA